MENKQMKLKDFLVGVDLIFINAQRHLDINDLGTFLEHFKEKQIDLELFRANVIQLGTKGYDEHLELQHEELLVEQHLESLAFDEVKE